MKNLKRTHDGHNPDEPDPKHSKSVDTQSEQIENLGVDPEKVLAATLEDNDLIMEIPITIGSLTTIIKSYSITGKVMFKSSIESQYYNKGSIFYFEILDFSSKIRIKVFNDDCELFYHQIQVGKIYKINKVYLTLSSPNAKVKCYDLVIDQDSEVLQMENEALSQLQNQYNLVPYIEILKKPADLLVDYIAKIHSIGEIENTTKKDGTSLSFRNVETVDRADNKITIVFWNTIASKGISSVGIGKTILFTKVKINSYKGEKKLFFNANSCMITDLAPSEIERLTTIVDTMKDKET